MRSIRLFMKTIPTGDASTVPDPPPLKNWQLRLILIIPPRYLTTSDSVRPVLMK